MESCAKQWSKVLATLKLDEGTISSRRGGPKNSSQLRKVWPELQLRVASGVPDGNF